MSGSLSSPSYLERNPSFLLQLEKNQEILPSTRDETLFRCGITREISSFLLSLESFLDTIETTQEVPQHSSLHSRGTPSVPHNSRRVPVSPPYLKIRIHFPASSGMESWRSCRSSGVSGLNLNLERNSRGPATIPKDPDIPMHSRYT